jgi:hypothetical protein
MDLLAKVVFIVGTICLVGFFACHYYASGKSVSDNNDSGKIDKSDVD